MSKTKRAKLFEKGLITEHQHKELKDHEALGIFSLQNEIRIFLFLAVMLFTSGVGIFIYKNIDSIGHVSILGIIVLITLICFYYSFKHAKGFSNEKVVSEKPLYDYLVLAADILLGIFIAYLQYQYNVFGTRYGLATLLPTVLYFFSAYYFDHKGVLSLAISGLFAAVGFSTSPESILNFEFSDDAVLGFSVLGIGIALILLTIYASKANLKRHFNPTYLNFAFHLICIVSTANLTIQISLEWFVFFIVATATIIYFIRMAYREASVNYLVFSLTYGYIIFNIILTKVIFLRDFYEVIMYLSPLYLVASILFFIKCLKDFKKKTKNAGIR
ncbi:DUF2157 domain-containing protein [Sphingobacteriaceae bacterium]|nr:DUF2157 domain-containing protein [Sphingobacteriaceae bacterium]